MKKQIVFVTMSLATLSGCSSSSSSPAGAINSKINASASNAFTGHNAVFEIGREMGQQASGNNNRLMLMPQFTDAAFAQATNSKNTIQGKAQALNTKIKRAGCPIQMKLGSGVQTGNPQQGGMSFPQMKVSIRGNGCPIEMDMEFKIDGNSGDVCREQQGVNSCKFVGRVVMSYRVIDQELRQTLGVSSGSMSMSFDTLQTMPGGNDRSGGINMRMAMKNAFEMKVVDLQGLPQLVSGSQDIDMTMQMDEPQRGQPPQMNMFGHASEDARYLNERDGVSSQLSARVKMTGASADEKYLIDGQSVTAKVYEVEREKFANSMMQFQAGEQEKDGGQGGGQNPSSPGGGNQPWPGDGQNPWPEDGGHVPDSRQPTPERPTQPTRPTNPPEDTRAWACSAEVIEGGLVIGYGGSEFSAQSRAKQECQAAHGAYGCRSQIQCAKQSYRSTAWYCESEDRYSNRNFGAMGRSVVEAKYLAMKACEAGSNSGSTFCKVEDAKCAAQ